MPAILNLFQRESSFQEMNSRRSGYPPHCDAHHKARWSVDRQMEFFQIKSNAMAKKFDGQDASLYRRWNMGIAGEVRGLELTGQEWRVLLDIQTSGVANNTVSRALDLEVEDPTRALEDL